MRLDLTGYSPRDGNLGAPQSNASNSRLLMSSVEDLIECAVPSVDRDSTPTENAGASPAVGSPSSQGGGVLKAVFGSSSAALALDDPAAAIIGATNEFAAELLYLMKMSMDFA